MPSIFLLSGFVAAELNHLDNQKIQKFFKLSLAQGGGLGGA